MKLYEKMGIDLNTVEGLADVMDLHCESVPDNVLLKGCIHPYSTKHGCHLCKAKRLLAEVPTKKRWETYEGDFVKAIEDYCKSNNYNNLVINKTTSGYVALSFAYWLMEEVEEE